MSDFDKNFHRLNNGNLFIDGNTVYGQAEEVNNPVIKAKMVDHKVLGMDGELELPTGKDKMTASFKLNGPNADVSAMSADVKTPHDFMFRGSVDIFKGQAIVAQRPYVAQYRGVFTEAPGGNQKQNENIDLTYNLSVTYYKLTINGVVKFEIDVINNIHIVNGVDTLATYRSNLGMS